MNLLDWLLSPESWFGSGIRPGILVQIGFHLLYSGVALAIAFVIGAPLGVYIGFTGKGEKLVAGLANTLRALPTFGLMILLFIVFAPIIIGQAVFLLPTIIVLVLLAVPPILTGAYTGIQSADIGAVGAARGMGYTRMQILFRVQLPCALPLIISGVRGATLQVVSTATVAAYLGLQGLGRFIIDGRAQSDFGQMAGGAVILALLALALEVLFLLLGNLLVSPGLRQVHTRKKQRPTLATTETTAITQLKGTVPQGRKM